MTISVIFCTNPKALVLPGDVLLVSGNHEIANRTDVAMWVLENPDRVVAWLPVLRILLPSSPTLDDMLACSLIEMLSNGEAIPDGVRPFARYADLVRQGVCPSQLPFEQSVEGIFMAIRRRSTDDAADLTLPNNAAAFLYDWRRMETRILAMARENSNPVITPLFSDLEFARERSILEADHSNYLHDKAVGSQWRVRFFGRDADALVLRSPVSLMFRAWARTDGQTSGKDGFSVLVVEIPKGQWTISTDPNRRVSLKGLGEQLQKAEDRLSAAPLDPPRLWYSGERHGFTIVGSPRNGTLLTDSALVRPCGATCA